MMTYYGGKELAEAFRTVRRNTVQIAEEIPDNKYDFKAAPDTRSVGQMLVHIALSTQLPLHVHGNKITDMGTINFQEMFTRFSAEEARPRTKDEIVALLKSDGEKFAGYLEGLPESFLAEGVKMSPMGGGATKTRFELLLSAKEHEMHHRAQLMMIQRILGQVPHLTRQMQQRVAQFQAAQAAQAQR